MPYIDLNQPWVYVCPPLPEPRLQPPSPSHPSGLSQCTGFVCPVSCIEHGLVIYFTYGNIHVSMLSSQICHSLIIVLVSFRELGDIFSSWCVIIWGFLLSYMVPRNYLMRKYGVIYNPFQDIQTQIWFLFHLKVVESLLLLK